MKHQLSNKLSPKAKEAILLAKNYEKLRCLLQVASSKNIDRLYHELESIGCSVRSYMEETHLMSVELDASQLQKVVNLDGVIYVEKGERYSK